MRDWKEAKDLTVLIEPKDKNELTMNEAKSSLQKAFTL